VDTGVILYAQDHLGIVYQSSVKQSLFKPLPFAWDDCPRLSAANVSSDISDAKLLMRKKGQLNLPGQRERDHPGNCGRNPAS